MDANDDELEERRQAELEFVTSAYSAEEAWCCDHGAEKGGHRVYRRLSLPADEDNDAAISIVLVLSMPLAYPASAPLDISCSIEEEKTSKGSSAPVSLLKAAYNAVPQLVDSCREVATEMMGDESVFTVLSHADEWISEQWPVFCLHHQDTIRQSPATKTTKTSAIPAMMVFGRRLIYSHHIISKTKRADMKSLALQYQLTGYIKIGWPGLIIIEGAEENCVRFYQDIKVWAWKYLVVRGEQQEPVRVVNSSSQQDHNNMDQLRKFSSFVEESDMSVVAEHCRNVGLESLFRTSMKQYDNHNGDEYHQSQSSTEQQLYGALVHVDHMNDGKNYRKWLRKTSTATDLFLLIKQCFPQHDFSKRPTIFVGIVGEQENVSDFLKRWRTSRVDVDSKGKACLERQMSVVIEGAITMMMEQGVQIMGGGDIDWDKANAEDSLNVDKVQLDVLIRSVGGTQWIEAVDGVLKG